MYIDVCILSQRLCIPYPQYIRIPGSTVADIPVPDQTRYTVLYSFLQEQGRTIERVLGDGNCLFRALSLQLTGVQDHHLKLRKIIAQYESKIDLFQGIHATINKTRFADHVTNIAKTCTWGTSLEIIATASLFRVDVYVATDSYRPGKPTWLKHAPNLEVVKELNKRHCQPIEHIALSSTKAVRARNNSHVKVPFWFS